jgi:hypothetical protein
VRSADVSRLTTFVASRKARLLRRAASQAPLWIVAHGSSMGRTIPSGSSVLVVQSSMPRRGEVWAFCDSSGTVVVHRYQRRAGADHVFQGDTHAVVDAPVGDAQLIGRVSAVRRDGRVRTLGWTDRVLDECRRVRRSIAARIARARRRTHHETVVVTPASFREGRVLDVAGVAMRISAADEARADALAAMLREAMPAPGPPSVELRFERGADAPLPWLLDMPFEIQRAESGVVTVRSELGLVARVTENQIVVHGEAADLRAAVRPVLSFALAHVLAARDRYTIHAATVGVDDGCVLVLGPSGAGKSTVALCALRSGWSVLGDDLAVLERVGDDVVATALPRPITAPPDVVDDPHAAPLPGDARGRVELPPGTVTAGTRSVVGLVVAAHGRAAESTARRLPSIAVPPVVITSCLVADTADARRELFPLTMALSRLPAFELAHGTQAATRIDEGSALLQRLVFR